MQLCKSFHVALADIFPGLVLCVRRFMLDAADAPKMEASKEELHALMSKPQLAGIPVQKHSVITSRYTRFF